MPLPKHTFFLVTYLNQDLIRTSGYILLIQNSALPFVFFVVFFFFFVNGVWKKPGYLSYKMSYLQDLSDSFFIELTYSPTSYIFSLKWKWMLKARLNLDATSLHSLFLGAAACFTLRRTWCPVVPLLVSESDQWSSNLRGGNCHAANKSSLFT